MDAYLNSYSIAAEGGRILINRDGIGYTAGMICSKADELYRLINDIETENIAVCCKDRIKELSAGIAAAKCGKRAVILDSRNGDAFNRRIIDELKCGSVINDGRCSFGDGVAAVQAGDISQDAQSDTECSLDVPEYLFPYISVDGGISTARYLPSDTMEFARFFTEKLGLDVSAAYADLSAGSVFSTLAWTITASNGAAAYLDGLEGRTLYIVPLSKAYELSEKLPSDACFLTYGQGRREAEIIFSEKAEKQKLRWYNVFGYPYCSYITRLKKNAGRYFHIGKPFQKVHTLVLNPDKEPLQFSLVGNIYDTRADDNAETAEVGGKTLYRTLYTGNFIGERNVLFKEIISPFEDVCGEYINTRYISETMKKIGGVKDCITKQVNDVLYAVCMAETAVSFDEAYKVFDSELPEGYKKTEFMFEYSGAFTESSVRLAGSSILLGIRNIIKEKLGRECGITVSGNNKLCISLPSDTHISSLEDILNEYIISARVKELYLTVCDNAGNEKASLTICEEAKEITEQEKDILEIWRAVLNKPDLSEDDNIYAAGGNSLDIMKIIYRISKYIGKDILVSMCESMETPRDSFALLSFMGSDDYSDKLYLERINDDVDDIISGYRYSSENPSENTVILSRDIRLSYCFAERILQRGAERAVCIADSVDSDMSFENDRITVIDLSRESETILGDSDIYEQLGRNTGRVICFAGAYEKGSEHTKEYSMDVTRVKEALKFSLYENKKSLVIIDDIAGLNVNSEDDENIYSKSRRVISSLCGKAAQAGLESRIIRAGLIGEDKNIISDVLRICAETGCLPSESEVRADISDPELVLEDILSGSDTTAVYSAGAEDVQKVLAEMGIQSELMPYELWYIMADQLAEEKNMKLPEVWKGISLFKDAERYISLYNSDTDKSSGCEKALRKLIGAAVKEKL